MSSQYFQYDQMVDGALRGVVRQVLRDVAKNGLRGAHHFYISFHTDRPDVQMPDYLRARYPQEITVVLQHQYWDLQVGEDAFDVTVSFNKTPEKLHIPYAALTAFVDPSVRFGLQFEEVSDKDGEDEAKAPAERIALKKPKEPGGQGLAGAGNDSAEQAGAAGEKANGAEADKDGAGGAKIVTLDAFRKK